MKSSGKKPPENKSKPQKTVAVVEEDEESDEEQWLNLSRILKIIPRDDPNDPFKPFSRKAIGMLAEGEPEGEPTLQPSDIQLLQAYGGNRDRCTEFDETDPPEVVQRYLPPDVKRELRRLPNWLRSFLESKYDVFYNRYQDKLPAFLQMLANRIYMHRLKVWSIVPDQMNDTDISQYLEKHDDRTNILVAMDKEIRSIRDFVVNPLGIIKIDPFRHKILDEILLVEENETAPELWSSVLVQRAADALRAVLLAGASDSEEDDNLADEWDHNYEELKDVREKRRFLFSHTEDEFTYKGPHWEDVVAQKEHFREKALWQIGYEFTPNDLQKQYYMETCVPVRDIRKHLQAKKNVYETAQETVKRRKKFRKTMADVERRAEEGTPVEKLQRQLQKAQDKEELAWEETDALGKKRKLTYYSYNPGHPLYRKPKNIIHRQARLCRERGVGKRPSRIYNKDECKGPISKVTRELHQLRPAESIHAYINFLVETALFRYCVMCVIIFNTILLAVEIEHQNSDYSLLFAICDSVFLSVYMVEFILKFTANPVQYFRSGFNVFDFIILNVSFLRSLVEVSSSDLSHDVIGWLRFFTLFRAFRILRGVSLSIHIQVLMRALLETLKNHVLSVTILLLLLMYISAIVAFYMFSDHPDLQHDWGKVAYNMVQLFQFVTVDGWYTLQVKFEEAKLVHEGRFFCFVCVVIGNFLFQNIFIAIIIMNISEATENFRKKQTEERESTVFRKQESVFRRQKLDMRHLLARQIVGLTDDFYELGSRFVRKLRHDDLVENKSIIFSPMWIDCFYKTMQRSHHSANILMNLHRKMADRLTKLMELYQEGQYTTRGISRARYNRYIQAKAKLAVLKDTFLELREVSPKRTLMVRLPDPVEVQERSKSFAQPPKVSKKGPKLFGSFSRKTNNKSNTKK